LSEPLLVVPLGRLPAAEDEEVDAEEAEEPLAAVVVEGVNTEVTTTVMGALDEPPF
jgi:glutamate dehydrogenase/leucine dehydrogenase